jgi:hypothetical protein
MSVNISIKKGDIIYVGKFRNKRIEAEKFSTDEHGQPLVNGKKILACRIEKLMPKSKRPKVKESIKEIIKEELKHSLKEGPIKTSEETIAQLISKQQVVTKQMNDILLKYGKEQKVSIRRKHTPFGVFVIGIEVIKD